MILLHRYCSCYCQRCCSPRTRTQHSTLYRIKLQTVIQITTIICNMLLHRHTTPARAAAEQKLLPRCHKLTAAACNPQLPTRRVQTNVIDKFRDLVSQFGPGGQQQQQEQQQQSQAGYGLEAEDDGADMVRIDTDSSGGLGGTTENVFGPLVSELMLGNRHAHWLQWLVICCCSCGVGAMVHTRRNPCPKLAMPMLHTCQILSIHAAVFDCHCAGDRLTWHCYSAPVAKPPP